MRIPFQGDRRKANHKWRRGWARAVQTLKIAHVVGGRPQLGVAWVQRVESGTSVGEKTELALVEQWRFREGVPRRMRPWSRQRSRLSIFWVGA
jgi:hypothetical protein